MRKKIVIIGCGAGGGTSAQFARKTDRKADITIFEKGRYPQYSRCGLPFVISGKISSNDLIEFSEDWFKRNGINLFLETEVESIERGKVKAKKGNEEIEKEFDTLVIATGADPILPFKKLEGVFVLRTIEDAQKISLEIKKGKKAVIIGAGLIGLEVADSLYKRGMEVKIVEALPRILPTLDEDMSREVLKEIDVDIYTNHIPTRIEGKNRIEKVVIQDKGTKETKEFGTDILVIAAGAKPNVSLAQKLGCKIGETGGIIINEKCQTSLKDIYAVGDCTEYLDFVTKKPINTGLGSIAVRQGKVAGTNAAGGEESLPPLLSTRTSEFFGVEIAAVGPTKEALKNVVTGRFKGSTLPSYFSGKPVIIKVGVNRRGKILYAQGVGSNVAQRINIFACAILNGMNIKDFSKLETAYSPSVAPPLDAITLVCEVVLSKLKGLK